MPTAAVSAVPSRPEVSELVARAEKIAAVAREHALETEQARRVAAFDAVCEIAAGDRVAAVGARDVRDVDKSIGVAEAVRRCALVVTIDVDRAEIDSNSIGAACKISVGRVFDTVFAAAAT